MKRGSHAEAEIIAFPRVPKQHKALVCHGTVGWRVAILYDILKQIGGGNWLTLIVALGRLVNNLKPGEGSYRFAWQGYLIIVRHGGIEIRLTDRKNGRLNEDFKALASWMHEMAVHGSGRHRLIVHLHRRAHSLEVVRSPPRRK